MTVSKLLVKEVVILLYACEVVNQGHVDKTAQSFNRSEGQKLKSHYPC